MIVRIMGRGQVEVDDAELDALNAFDNDLMAAIDGGKDDEFKAALGALVERVCAVGRPVPDDALVPSDAVLPDPDASVDEVRELLGDEGLIPG